MEKRHLLHSLLLVCWFCSPAVFADALLDQARELLDNRQPDRAYELLDREYQQRAGDPQYDLLLGIAALDSGRPTRAVFAFERVLEVEPDNARARAELARAYFEMGENEAAREEFNDLRRREIPESVSRSIDRYMSQIDARLAATRRRVSVFIEGSAGYDSNVNAATDTSTVAIPAFGNLIFTLDDSGREQDSGFFGLAAGTAFSGLIGDSDNLRIVGGADIRERITVDATDFRTRLANGQVGLRYTQGNNTVSGSVLGQKYWIGGEDNRDLFGVNLQWQRTVATRTQVSAYGRFEGHRFPNQPVRDVNQFSGGLGLVHLLAAEGDPIVYASVFGGIEDEEQNNRPDLGKDFIGVRLGGEYTLSERSTLVGNLSYQYSRYGGDDPLFLERRKDHFVFARAGLEYTLAKRWMLRPEIQFTHNDSTLPINEFDRWTPFITIRNQF